MKSKTSHPAGPNDTTPLSAKLKLSAFVQDFETPVLQTIIACLTEWPAHWAGELVSRV